MGQVAGTGTSLTVFSAPSSRNACIIPAGFLGMRISTVVLAPVAALLLVSSARADDARTKALEHFDRGRALYQVSEYRAALGEFKQAFLIKEDAVFIFNIAQCHRRLEEPKPAITFYKRYLAAVPDAVNRVQVQKFIDDLEAASAQPATALPEVLPGVAAAQPLPVAKRPTPTPPITQPYTPPPRPAPLVSVAGEPKAQPAEEEPVYRRWWFWTGAGALVAGAVVSALVLSSGERRATSCGPGVDSCAPVRQ